MTDKTALLVAAHGDRGGTGANKALLVHCDTLARGAGFAPVAGGVLKGEPSLEDATSVIIESRATRLLVYPLFMADGYFTRKVLPQRLSDALTGAARQISVSYAAPLGIDEALPALTLNRVLRTAGEAGFIPEQSRLLIVGHGSKLGPASAQATESFAAQLRLLSPFARVETAFLEEDVLVKDALVSTAMPTVVEGFFSGDGLHAGADVPQVLQQTGAQAAYAGSIGADPALSGLILDAARALEVLSAPG